MGDVVTLRPEPVSAAWRAWVQVLCFLAGQPDRADDFLSRGASRGRIVLDLRVAAPTLRQGDQAATYLRELRGSAGTARRPLPIHPVPHGTCRRPKPRTTPCA